MKIALIGQKGIPTKQGGIEKHVEELSQRLAGLGFDIYVYSRPHYTSKTEKSYQYNGVNIVNLPSFKTKHFDAITHTLISTIDALKKDYDIIHYHGVGPALLSFIPRLFKPRVKVIVTFHCIDRYHQKWGIVARFMLALGERAACVFPHQTIVISKTLQKYCRYRFDHEAAYIPNGVNPALTENLEILKQFNLEPKNYIIAVSRLIRHKGLHTLINAYNIISKNTNSIPKLVIVGDGSSTDDYVKEIKTLATDNDNIIFTGMQTGADLNSLYMNAGIFVQPSEAEGLSIALLEGMAYSIPAIISNIEENQEPAEGYALEFINKSTDDLAKKLDYALSHPTEMAELAKQAKLRTETEYNWDNIAKATGQAYLELAGLKLLERTQLS